AMTDVTVKVLPRAETEQTLLAFGLDDRTAVRAMAAALGSAADVSGAAHMPARAAPQVAGAAAAGRAVTALRLEGVAPSLAPRRAGSAAQALWRTHRGERAGIARTVEGGARRDAVRGARHRGSRPAVAHFDGAVTRA